MNKTKTWYFLGKKAMCTAICIFLLFGTSIVRAQAPCDACSTYTGQAYTDCIATCGGDVQDTVPVNGHLFLLVIAGIVYGCALLVKKQKAETSVQ